MFRQFLEGFPKDQPRLAVQMGVHPQVVVDGVAYSVKAGIARFFQALLDAQGQVVTMSSQNLRSRQLEALPDALRALIERTPGEGCRLRLPEEPQQSQ
jgi:hypothetical protein